MPKRSLSPGHPRAAKRCKAAASAEVNDGKTAPNIIVVCGPPAAGKGTMCAKLVEKHGFVHVSTGELLRNIVEKPGSSGFDAEVVKKVKECMAKGEYVPDHVICRLVKDCLVQPDVLAHGCVLDGFPRKKIQAEAMWEEGIAVKQILFIDVCNEDELCKRACGRRMGPNGEIFHNERYPAPPEKEGQLKHRTDDNPETFKKRWETYKNEGPPMEEFLGETYGDRFQKIDGLGSIDQVFEQIRKVVKPMHAAMWP